ncbi:MAG: RagB/SusD family nutrient uptake outer membrane protein [Bacteroidales bacterium]|nr:RagB/SusD family nutrient uptake outer membrane protein [Bacteroidales bacterium]MCL2133342.1 RagB/SusD family nutrient uptake outer membrane protein [Bacteroidales bacterium]
MKTLKYILPIILLALFACDKDYLNETPPDTITADVLYKSALGFQSGLNGIYGLMRAERQGVSWNGGMSNYQYEVGASFYVGVDDIHSGSGSGQDPVNVVVNQAGARINSPDRNYLSNLFNWLYSVINAANTIINRAEMEDIDWLLNGQDQKARVLGEAHLARGWAYRLLVAGWGDVPIKLDESEGTNIQTDFERAPEQEVWAQMKEDFLIAARNIPWRPYTTGSPTKGVALHYLAEACLALNEPDQAERYLNILIGNGTISAEDIPTFGSTDRSLYKVGLPNAYNEMFEPNNVDWAVNSETLWTWQWAVNTVGGGNNTRRQTLAARFANSAYTLGSVNHTCYFDRQRIALNPSDERGGMGWGASFINPRVYKLYYRSSPGFDPANPDPPYASGSTATENVNYWKNFEFEDRFNDRAFRKFFRFDPSVDSWTGRDLNPNAPIPENSQTGQPWQIGDTIYMGIASNSNDNGMSNIGLSMAYDYRISNRTSQTVPYPVKFSYTNQGYAYRLYSNLNQIYLRLGESYLLRAEARVKRGNLSGATDDVNMLRTRARARLIDVIPGATLQDQLDFILDERSRELIGEEQRRATLSRMGRYDFMWRRVQMYNYTDRDRIDRQDIRFAIPQSVIDANLTKPFPQNPGWSGVPINYSLYPLIEFPWSANLPEPDMK